MRQKRDFFIDSLHIFVLFSFAVAQPLFDLLSGNAGFFVARHSEPVDVILLILILCVLLPALAVSIEVVTGLFGQRVRKGVHGLLVTGLVAIILLPALNKIDGISYVVLLMGAISLGVVFNIAYIRFHPVRMFLTVLSPALLVFPGLFLFNSPVFKIVFPEKDPGAVMLKLDDPPPIIMVVFDEFTVTSLMDEHRQIDPIRYPNFAAIAQEATWFRNATTVSGCTLQAIPAILTGSYPEPSRVPTAADYPRNLFSLLGSSYRMKVFESHTMICPEKLCGCEKRHQTFAQRMHSMLLDLSAVYLHIIVPSDLTAGFPIVRQTWKNFWGETKANKDHVPKKERDGLFSELLRSITISDKPTLYFLHVLFPHVPWEYLPSGKRYTVVTRETPGLNIKKEQWGEDEWLVIQGYQRHLLQVGFVDKLVGDLLDRLKSLNIYDESLIVITADHGVNFWPNESRRERLKRDLMGILGIPLFIKAPNQHEGVISDYNVKSIDILPTITDILDIRIPWPVDGRSALDSCVTSGIENVNLVRKEVRAPFVSNHTLVARDDAVQRKLALFGSGAKPYGLFRIGPFGDIVGWRVSKLQVGEDTSVAIKLEQEWLYDYVDPKATWVPAYISGRLRSNQIIEAHFNLGVAVNGTIRAVTRTFDHEGVEAKFTALVPEASFRAGKNEVEVFIVSTGTDGQPQVMRTESQRRLAYSLSSSGEALIRHPDGTFVKIIPTALEGWVRADHMYFYGWAADVKSSQPAEAIVAFMNGKFLFSGRAEIDRPDVAQHFDNPALQRTGFKFQVPFSLFEDTATTNIRFFAVLNDVASELNYEQGYMWRKKQSSTTCSFSMSSKDGCEIITSSNGASIPVIPNALKGYLDVANVGSDRVVFAGWAADVKNSQLPETIVIFVNGEFFYSGLRNLDRPDVVKAFDNAALKRAGFEYVFPLSLFKNIADFQVRFFAVSKEDVASELIYPKGYTMGKNS